MKISLDLATCGLLTFVQGTSNLLGCLRGQFEFQVVGGQEVGHTGDGQINQTTITLLGALWQLSVDILFAKGLATTLHGAGGISATNMNKSNLEQCELENYELIFFAFT